MCKQSGQRAFRLLFVHDILRLLALHSMTRIVGVGQSGRGHQSRKRENEGFEKVVHGEDPKSMPTKGAHDEPASGNVRPCCGSDLIDKGACWRDLKSTHGAVIGGGGNRLCEMVWRFFDKQAKACLSCLTLGA